MKLGGEKDEQMINREKRYFQYLSDLESLVGTVQTDSELPLLSDIGGNVVSGLAGLAGLHHNCLCFVSKILKFGKICCWWGGEDCFDK